jgi:hypothetical protein
MEDSSEDLPKPQRRTAARPFFSPRVNSGEGASGPLDLSRRRTAQLFTPPGSSSATPVADKGAAGSESVAKPVSPKSSDAADGSSASASTADASSDVEFEGDWTPAPLNASGRTLEADSAAEAAPGGDDDHLVVEQFEPKEITLTAADSTTADEHSIEVIAYDDANSLLKAATIHGRNPEVDGLTLEATEFSFEQEAPRPRTDVDSFWANEPFSKSEARDQAPSRADETEATIDEETAGEPVSVAADVSARPTEAEPVEWRDDPSTTIAHAQASIEPEPEHDPLPPREATPVLADIATPWMHRATPVSSQSLEKLKELEPWDITPKDGMELIPEEPDDFVRAHESELEAQRALHAAAASVAAARDGLAGALERIAARVRDGNLDVQAEAGVSDEAALSAVLTALLRARR